MSLQGPSAQRRLKGSTSAMIIDINSRLWPGVGSGACTCAKIASPVLETEISTWVWTPKPLQTESGDEN